MRTPSQRFANGVRQERDHRYKILSTTFCCVRRRRQIEQQLRKLRWLTEEEAIADEAVDRTHRIDLAGRCWANYSACGQIWTDELARYGEDQISLNQGIRRF